jgi:hypothetical protein
MAAPRPRRRSELRDSDRRLRSKSQPRGMASIGRRSPDGASGVFSTTRWWARRRRSTVLAPAEEAMAMVFRRRRLLPLDDCLHALQASIPHLARSALHRCFQRYDISRLPQSMAAKPRRRPSSPTRSASSTSTSPKCEPKRASSTFSSPSTGPRNAPSPSSCRRRPRARHWPSWRHWSQRSPISPSRTPIGILVRSPVTASAICSPRSSWPSRPSIGVEGAHGVIRRRSSHSLIRTPGSATTTMSVADNWANRPRMGRFVVIWCVACDTSP